MTPQPLLQHLLELRQCLVRAVSGVVILFALLFHWSGSIYHLLALPLLSRLPLGSHMIAIDVTAPLFVPMKVTMLLALLLSLPHTLYRIWLFIAPALYRHEKSLILPLLISSVVLFFIGMAFAYFVVFPLVFGFMAAVTPRGVVMMTDIDKYLSFVMSLFLAFGSAFEMPVLVVFLVQIGVLDIPQLRRARPYVIVGSFVVAAIVTPPDVLSQTSLALPMCLLFEIGVLSARLMLWQRARRLGRG
jgi:sec-independent protein translocase protein TatC